MPAPVDGIQVNTCRNAACSNFGVEPLLRVPKGRLKLDGSSGPRDLYILTGSARTRDRPNDVVLTCKKCGGTNALKSNLAIREELDRISAYLDPMASVSCQNQLCECFRFRVDLHPKLYHKHGQTPFGTPRWKCKGCGKTVSAVVHRRRYQEKSFENKTVFKALINKNSIKSISRIAEISPQTVYDKIEFIHRQCMMFVAERERTMPRRDFGRRYISVDRQDYVINWSDRLDRRPTQLTAVASADNRAGYVYGMHLNFDPDVDLETIEHQAIRAGDFDHPHPAFRRYARYWMQPDLDTHKAHEAQAAAALVSDKGDVLDQVKAREIENHTVPDPEDKERLHHIVARLPGTAAQVHFVYTVQAHFRLLERLLAGSGKLRFYMDQDETLRAGCISSFAWRVKMGQVDAFFVKIDKKVGIDTRRQRVAESKRAFKIYRDRRGHPEWSDWRVRLELIKEMLPDRKRQRGFRDSWIMYPEYTINEPGKAVSYLTDRGDYGLDHLASLYARATMHAVDRYFMQIRRLLMMLERPISSRVAGGSMWHGYSPYNPTIIQKLLDIFRVHYNYCKPEEKARKGRDGKLLPRRTPAMKLGLAKGLVRIEDILYFDSEKTEHL